MSIGAAQEALPVANRAAVQAVAGEPTQTASLRTKGAALSFLAVSVFFDDFAPRKVDSQATATGGAHLPGEFGPPHRLSVESGICDHA